MACWASRQCILGVLAIQRVDGPSLAMSTHPSNSSSFLGQLFGSSVGAMSQTTGVFRDSPRARRRAGGGLRRSSLAAALGQDSSTRWRSGTRDTLNVASGLVSSQSAFVFEFVDQGCVAAVPFFFPHIAARPPRRVSWGGEGSRKTATGFPQNPSVKC